MIDIVVPDGLLQLYGDTAAKPAEAPKANRMKESADATKAPPITGPHWMWEWACSGATATTVVSVIDASKVQRRPRKVSMAMTTTIKPMI
jgi:hypothetical protein